MRRVLYVATVVKMHIMEFHIPFLKVLKEMGWETGKLVYRLKVIMKVEDGES